MKVCTFRTHLEALSESRVGIVKGGRVFELRKHLDFFEFIDSWAGGSGGLRLSERSIPVGQVVFGAPIRRPGKIVAAIVNTQGMLGGKDVTLGRPRLDMKAPSTVIGPGEKVLAPSQGIRPEVELAVIVGEAIAGATPSQARKAIFGYTVLNDVTAPHDARDDAYEAYRRDRKTGEIRKTTMRGPLFRSKNHDTFCPMGPWVVTADELVNVGNLRMSTTFRSKKVQEGSTSEYIFQPWELASYVSGFLSLEPGDVVSCGSVGWAPRALGGLDPTEYVLPSREGSLVLEVEGIGRLSNPVVPAR